MITRRRLARKAKKARERFERIWGPIYSRYRLEFRDERPNVPFIMNSSQARLQDELDRRQGERHPMFINKFRPPSHFTTHPGRPVVTVTPGKLSIFVAKGGPLLTVETARRQYRQPGHARKTAKDAARRLIEGEDVVLITPDAETQKSMMLQVQAEVARRS